MKNILLFVMFCFLASCSKSDEEKKLELFYERLESLAKTPEEKAEIKEQYKVALENLYEEKEYEEKKSKIIYSENNDVTSEFLKFCDELWADEDYNPAKYSVKEKEFNLKSVTLKGTIAYIVSEDDRNYIAMYYKKEKKELDWLNTKERSIIFLIDFEKPEDIMNFKEGQKFTVKTVIDYSHKSDGVFSGEDYFFNFFKPIIKIE